MRLTLKGIHSLPSDFLSQRAPQLTLGHPLGNTYTLKHNCIFYPQMMSYFCGFIGCLFLIT